MTDLTRLLAVAAAFGSVAVPAAAQYNPYPNQPGYDYPSYPGQEYPEQTYPGQSYPTPSYPGEAYPGYGYNQGYGGNPVVDIIDQLLGNRYSVTDRQAIHQCARAATEQARAQYGGYGNSYGYNQGFAAPSLRVSSITEVERRSNGLRVRGTLSTGYQGQYRDSYGYPGQGSGDVSFRCNIDYRGVVTDIRIRGYGRRY